MNTSIESILGQWSEKLGIGSQVIWESLMLQANISGITSTLACIVFFFLAIHFSRRAKKMFIKSNSKDTPSFDREGFLGLGLISIGIAVIVAMIALPIADAALTTLINPEYWAISHLKSLLP